MRPIDADAIPYTMLYKENWIKGTGREEQGVWKSDIDKLPTIEAEQKRGRWIKEYNGNGWNDYWDYTCSACEKTIKRGETYPYCPNCGAKMEDE